MAEPSQVMAELSGKMAGMERKRQGNSRDGRYEAGGGRAAGVLG